MALVWVLGPTHGESQVSCQPLPKMKSDALYFPCPKNSDPILSQLLKVERLHPPGKTRARSPWGEPILSSLP